MAQTRTFTRSFAGGEITPELFGRFDLAKTQTGLEICRNFIVLPHGPVANRPGFEFIQRVKDSSRQTRIIPFNYNTEQTYIIELGHQYIRFHTNGGTLLSGTSLTITGVSQADPGVLTYTGTDPTNGTWMYLAAIGGMTELNGRYVKVANVDGGANTFELTDLYGNDIDTTAFTAYTSGGTATAVYEIASPYVEADLFDIHFTQSADILTLVHPSYAPRELSRASATSWSLNTITFAPAIAAPTSLSAAATSGSGAIVYDYVATAIAADGLEESLQSANDTVANDLSGSGAKNTITWVGSSGAVRYNVYRKDDGIYGYIGQSATTSFVDNNITPDLAITPPNANTPFGSSNNYPAAVTYAEQRRVFAGTNNRSQTTWMTRAGTESNLTYSIPTRDDDSITFRIAARENNAIRHAVPLGDLLLLTANAAWRISAANQEAITPSSITAKPQAYIGANNVQPVVTPSSILFAQAQGTRLQELVYVTDGNGANGYQVNDVSIMAPHLFPCACGIVDMAYAHSPFKVCWAVRGNGALLGMTYVPQHEVVGWHRHDTDGLFESVAVIPENNMDTLYAVVQRTINSQTVRYIERMHTREFQELEDCFFVDSGLTYDGSATDTVRGLYHLEGEEVAILADGAVHPPVTVTNGVVELEAEASVIHIGLPIEADVKLLPAAISGEAALGQGRPKNVNEAWLRVDMSSGIFAGPSFDDLTEIKPRLDEPYGSPPALKSGELDLVILPGWTDSASISIRQSEPLPLTLVALTMEMEVGG